jgi:hypothetical protein
VVSSIMVCLASRKFSVSSYAYHGELQGGIVLTFTWKTQWFDLNELCILGDDVALKRLDFYRAHMIVLFDIDRGFLRSCRKAAMSFEM